MTLKRVIVCNGCGSELTWKRGPQNNRWPTQAQMEQAARNRGWNAPDKLGRHWCESCRRSPRPKPPQGLL